MTTHVVCSEEDLPVGGMKAVRIGDTGVVVYRLEDGFYATQSTCTHMFAPLGRGRIVDGCKVQCPLHRARFDIRTGEVVDWANFPPGVQLLNAVRGEKALRTYPVTVVKGQVRVRV
ncbi:MAG: non-heme iron oxygenase ferredoxin subunit [Proteobacteria bacterium]|nr:non-heme iron oxygenase ferredoxin subunit [Pseudomonadota bacterium]